ncbi:hypothetical protein [Streptomyces sp. TP-A0874]|uniref:hypothetical protein n=1 Tax=Streptomyces sp. TP-A0874 TaxID=549819 RepID=UPI0008532676|nr:hypothetical protein [Streptomyces sp. TP-A0874]
MLTLFISVFGGIAAVVLLTVLILLPGERRLRRKGEEENNGRRAAAEAAGWRIVEETSELPALVRRDARDKSTWLLAHKHVDNVDIWVACQEGVGGGVGGLTTQRSLIAHLRPKDGAEELPELWLNQHDPFIPRFWKKLGAFDRRYTIHPHKQRQLVTEDIRTLTVKLGPRRWSLRDGILTVFFNDRTVPSDLQHRQLITLLRQLTVLTGPEATPGPRT